MKKLGCAQCGGTKKMKTGGTTAAKRNISKPGAGFAKATKGGSNATMGIYGVPNAGMTGPNRNSVTETMKAGGSFAPNRAVKSSCKGGMVTDENGRCVMQRKMAKGGFPDLTGDNKVTQADILKGRGVFKKGGENWIKGAIKRPGAFSAKAKAAGMSTSAFAAKVSKPGSKASTLTKRQANLAKTLGKMRKK
jgi:hypothetical protein